jgi:hypothetical protein
MEGVDVVGEACDSVVRDHKVPCCGEQGVDLLGVDAYVTFAAYGGNPGAGPPSVRQLPAGGGGGPTAEAVGQGADGGGREFLAPRESVVGVGERVGGCEEEPELIGSKGRGVLPGLGEQRLKRVAGLFHGRYARRSRCSLECVGDAEEGLHSLSVAVGLQGQEVAVQCLDLLIELAQERHEETRGELVFIHES